MFDNFWGGGPSNWLSYTESGLLDSGFGGEGIELEIELKDAEDDKEETRYKDYPEPEDEEQDREGTEREHFFVVENVKVDVSQSFDFKIKNSRHWIINSLIRTTSKPIVKLVLERVFSSLVENGLVGLDKKAYDLYSRAKYLRNHRHHRHLKRGEELSKPGLLDFLIVFFSPEKGKSEKRLRKEKKEKEEKEKKDEEEKRKKDEELREIRENQPKGMKEMQIKPSGIIKTDPSGSYSIAIGVKPILLPYEDSGPPTLATELRKDVTEGDLKRLGKRSTAGIRRAAREADVLGNAEQVGEMIKDGIEGVGQVREQVGELRENEGKAEESWRSDLFDL